MKSSFGQAALVAAVLAANSAFGAGVDDPEVRALAHRIVAVMADTDRHEERRLTYVYAGPFAWSTPEERLTITWDDNARIEYRVLVEHSRVLALQAVEDGASDPARIIASHSRVWLQTDAAHCPAAMQALAELESTYAKQIDVDRQPHDPTHVPLDGGSSTVFLFGTQHYSSYGYTAFSGGELMRRKADELKKRILECQPH